MRADSWFRLLALYGSRGHFARLTDGDHLQLLRIFELLVLFQFTLSDIAFDGIALGAKLLIPCSRDLSGEVAVAEAERKRRRPRRKRRPKPEAIAARLKTEAEGAPEVPAPAGAGEAGA